MSAAQRQRARLAVAVCALSAVAVAATGGVLVRCTADGGGADASPDVRYGHYRPDQGSPPLGDAGDAGLDEAGPDADPCAITSDWPGFRRLTEFDPCAPADVLVDPDAGYTMSWTDCGDAGIGACTELVQLSPQAGMYAYATYDDAGSGNLLYLSQATAMNSTVGQFDIVDLKSSQRLGEWRIDIQNANGTQIILPNTTGTTTAFLGWRPGLYAQFAPAQMLFSNPLALTSYPTAPTQDINWAMSDEVMAFQPLSAPYTICRVDAGTCAQVDVKSMPGLPYYAFAWHDVVFAVDEHGSAGWAQEYVIHADGSVSLLRSNPNAHIWGMTTDGTTLVWEETMGASVGRSERREVGQLLRSG